jgi:hypothetical protein
LRAIRAKGTFTVDPATAWTGRPLSMAKIRLSQELLTNVTLPLATAEVIAGPLATGTSSTVSPFFSKNFCSFATITGIEISAPG